MALLHNVLLCYPSAGTRGARARHGLLSVGHASPVGIRGALTVESFGFRGREILHKNVEIFAVGKIAEFARFAGGERRKSPDRFPLNALLRRFIRIRGAYKPCRRSCGRLALTQFRPFPVLTEERTAFWANECSIESPCTATHGRTTPYFREAGNINDGYQNPI